MKGELTELKIPCNECDECMSESWIKNYLKTTSKALPKWAKGIGIPFPLTEHKEIWVDPKDDEKIIVAHPYNIDAIDFKLIAKFQVNNPGLWINVDARSSYDQQTFTIMIRRDPHLHWV